MVRPSPTGRRSVVPFDAAMEGSVRPASTPSSRVGPPSGAQGRPWRESTMADAASKPSDGRSLLAVPILLTGFSVAQAKSVGGLAEPAGEVVVQVLLIVADPGDVAVGA